MLVGVSPFERVLGEAGGSLALAVQNGRVQWPEGDEPPSACRELVAACLMTDHEQRPFISDLLLQLEDPSRGDRSLARGE